MPDRLKHRGKHPKDELIFASKQESRLSQAVGDLSWLMSRDYSAKAAVKLVGDHFQLTARQRLATERCACSLSSLEIRENSKVEAERLAGQSLCIDGYNLLITIESALSGGIIFEGIDGVYRDLASVHGTYRRVEETIPAISLIGDFLVKRKVSDVHWYFDAPVSNSGRLKTLLRKEASKYNWPWEIELVNNPDTVLAKSDSIIVSSDSWILDRCERWTNLAKAIITEKIPDFSLFHIEIKELKL